MWTGAPQWQIEGLRRLEIPEDMQKKYGFTPLGARRRPGQDRDLRRQCRHGSTSSIDSMPSRVDHDRFAAIKADYLANGGGRSNLRYGYVARPA